MEWKIKIDLGVIESFKYGTALNLKAELPLLSGSSYKIPTIVSDSERILKIGSELANKFRSYFPRDSDSKVIGKCSFQFLFGTYQNPELNWDESPGLQAIVELMINAIALDDVVDNVEMKIQRGVANYRVLAASLSVLDKPELNIETFLPGTFESDPDDPEDSLKVFPTRFNSFNEAILNVRGHAWDPCAIRYFYDELMSSSTATYLTLASKSSPTFAFSHTSYNRQILQHIHAMRESLEVNALVASGASMPEKVRNSLLFRMLLDSFGNGTALINAIVGLRKDIAEDAWPDTPILRDVVQKGCTLQQAFDSCVQNFKAEVWDINIILEILQETYGDIEGVDEFLKVFEHTFMGTCLVYADETCRDRYIGCSVEVVTTPATMDPIVKFTAPVGRNYKVVNTKISTSNDCSA